MSTKFYKKSLKFNVLERINQLEGNVVLRTEIQDMGSARQISRCLKDLIAMGELAKIGHGVYAKAFRSERLGTNVIQGGFGFACKEALTKLGIDWLPGTSEQAYNEGRSTQVPLRTIVRLKSRFRRRLGYGNRRLIVEKNTNAK